MTYIVTPAKLIFREGATIPTTHFLPQSSLSLTENRPTPFLQFTQSEIQDIQDLDAKAQSRQGIDTISPQPYKDLLGVHRFEISAACWKPTTPHNHQQGYATQSIKPGAAFPVDN